MMKNGVGRKDTRQEGVIAGDCQADLLGGRGLRRVGHDELGPVRALTAYLCTRDPASGGVERHPFRQWRIVWIRADGKAVRRSAAGGGKRAAGVRGALRAARTGGGADGQ